MAASVQHGVHVIDDQSKGNALLTAFSVLVNSSGRRRSAYASSVGGHAILMKWVDQSFLHTVQ